MRQDNYAWSKWGQYVETKGKTRRSRSISPRPSACSSSTILDEHRNRGVQAMRGARSCATTPRTNGPSALWRARCSRSSCATDCKACRKGAVFWEPTAMIGIYRVDEMYWNKAVLKEARR